MNMTRRLSQSSLSEESQSGRSPAYGVGPSVERVSPRQLYIFLTGHEPSPSSLPYPSQSDDSTVDHARATKRMRLGEDGDSVSIWEERAEVCFLTCIAHIPPLERQKVMFFGKPCGRNEVIALIVSLATGNLRHRKQVSSHAQVIKGRPGLHPYLASLFEAENHAPLEETSTVGNAVVLRFPRVLYDFMGIPFGTDLASAQKPDWFVAAEQDINSQSKDSEIAHEAKSSRTLAVTPGSTRALRNSSPQKDDSQCNRNIVTHVGSKPQAAVGAAVNVLLGDPLSARHRKEADDVTASDHFAPTSEKLHSHLQSPEDITIWSRCGGIPRCLADCAARAPRLRGFAVEDIPLVGNRYKSLEEDFGAGCRVLHVDVPLRLPRAPSYRVDQLQGLIDLSVVVNLSSSGERPPMFRVVAAGGFNDQCLFREEVPIEGKRPVSGPQPWQARAILNTKILNGILTSPGLDVEELLLPHVWLKQSITTLSLEAVPPTSPILGNDHAGSATVILVYTFTIGDGDVRISSL